VHRSTLQRDIKTLLQQGLLHVEGQGAGRCYTLCVLPVGLCD